MKLIQKWFSDCKLLRAGQDILTSFFHFPVVYLSQAEWVHSCYLDPERWSSKRKALSLWIRIEPKCLLSSAHVIFSTFVHVVFFHLNALLPSRVLHVPIPNYGSSGQSWEPSPKGQHLHKAFPDPPRSEGLLSELPEHLVFTSAPIHRIPPWIITVYIWSPMSLSCWRTTAGPCPSLHHSAPRKESMLD